MDEILHFFNSVRVRLLSKWQLSSNRGLRPGTKMTQQSNPGPLKATDPLAQIFLQIQEILKPRFSVEVGAHRAEFSQEMFKQGICRNVFAFEASEFVYQKYELENAQFTYRNLAITNYDGFVEFELQLQFTDQSTIESNSILKRNDKSAKSYLIVECKKLDSLFGDADEICLWIDVEGANQEVLTGADEVLEKTTSIFIETEHLEYWEGQWLHLDVVSYLYDRGFVILDMRSYGGDQSNVIFLRKDLMAKVLFELNEAKKRD